MSDPAQDQENSRPRRLALTLVAILGLAVAAGMLFAWRYADGERQRDLDAWRVRLGLVASGGVTEISQWLADRQAALAGLAENPSVPIYVSQIAALPTGDTAAGQRGYLRNLLTAEAQRGGFARALADVPAAVDMPRTGGLILTLATGEIIAASPNLPPLASELAAVLTDPGTPRFTPGLGLLMLARPVRGVQAAVEDPPIGWAIGVLPLADGLSPLLTLPAELTSTAQMRLYNRQPDGSAVTIAGQREDPAAADAIAAHDDLVIGPNDQGLRVLAVARAVPDVAGWYVVRSVGADEVLSPINQRRNRILFILGFGLLALAATILLVWRHGASVRVASAMQAQAQAARRNAELYSFLRTVSDGQPTLIMALDPQGKLRFANRAVARLAGVDADDLIGRSLDSALGHDLAEPFAEALSRGQAALPFSTSIDRPGPPRQVLNAHFRALPARNDQASLLIVAEDVSELVDARERRELSLRRLVETLATLIDARDPYSANHSARVADVAGSVAATLKLSQVMVETVTIAGTLMNLGKILVPREVLTKRSELSAGELKAVRESLMKSADLLEHLSFDGPVADTLRQVQAHFDGSGRPEGLAGDDILITARVLAVANAFVGMVSPRAHRDSIGLDEAVVALNAKAGSVYDKKVVVALAHALENEGGRARWQRFAERPGLPMPG